MNPLTPKRRSELRSEAHKLSPLVIIGDKGLTEEVLAEIDRTLKAHELVKVRAATDDRKARDAWLEQIGARLEAHAVQQIGKVFVLYRENPEARAKARAAAAPVRKVAAKLPPKPNARGKGRAKPAAAPPRFRRVKEAAKEAADEVKRTSRRQSRTPEPRPESGPRRRPRNTSR
jgi:RNA-binding protein